MLTKIRHLITALNASDIRYCHWKSNKALDESLAGLTDIDLLVHRRDAPCFRGILSQYCFKPARMDKVAALPSVEHYVGLDEVSGDLIHVHAYYRVLTGESLAKNYRFPIEELLLQNARLVDAVPVPVKSAELLVFTLRMMLKHTSLLELGLLSRYWQEVSPELEWLLDDQPLEPVLALLATWLPAIDPQLFSDCIHALRQPAPLWNRIRLGLRLRSQLRPYARHSVLMAEWSGVSKFSRMFLRRLARSKLALTPQAGGAVIAFVGPEATGKSTLLSAVSQEFGRHLAVERIHAGKPRSTLLGAVPNLLVPALRRLFPTLRSTRVDVRLRSDPACSAPDQPAAQKRETGDKFPLVYALRSVLLAYDRRALLTRSFRRAANGTIVFCDRYPSVNSGAPDSPQLATQAVEPGRFSVRRLLAQTEARLYRQIPPPDLVIYLRAPLDLTLARNASRDKTEPEDYVRWRHARSSNLTFGKTPVYTINTDQTLEHCVLEAKNVIWNAL